MRHNRPVDEFHYEMLNIIASAYNSQDKQLLYYILKKYLDLRGSLKVFEAFSIVHSHGLTYANVSETFYVKRRLYRCSECKYIFAEGNIGERDSLIACCPQCRIAHRGDHTAELLGAFYLKNGQPEDVSVPLLQLTPPTPLSKKMEMFEERKAYQLAKRYEAEKILETDTDPKRFWRRIQLRKDLDNLGDNNGTN